MAFPLHASEISVLLCSINTRVRKIRKEASSCPGIFSRTLRFYNVNSSPGSPLPHLLDAHRKLVGSSTILAKSCPGPVTNQRREEKTCFSPSRIVAFLPVQKKFVPAGPKSDVFREAIDKKRHHLKVISEKCDKSDAWHFLSPKKGTKVLPLTQIWDGKLGRNSAKTNYNHQLKVMINLECIFKPRFKSGFKSEMILIHMNRPAPYKSCQNILASACPSTTTTFARTLTSSLTPSKLVHPQHERLKSYFKSRMILIPPAPMNRAKIFEGWPPPRCLSGTGTLLVQIILRIK